MGRYGLGKNDRYVRLWDVERRQPFGEPLAGHIQFIRSSVFSPDGKMLVSASNDQMRRLWDLDGQILGVAFLRAGEPQPLVGGVPAVHRA